MLLKKEEVVKVFQNINETEKTREEFGKRKSILANAISKKYIILYILTFMLSYISMGYNVSPFSLAIIGATISNEIPVIAVLIFALTGNIIGSRMDKYFKFYSNIINIFCKLFSKRTKIQRFKQK